MFDRSCLELPLLSHQNKLCTSAAGLNHPDLKASYSTKPRKCTQLISFFALLYTALIKINTSLHDSSVMDTIRMYDQFTIQCSR